MGGEIEKKWSGEERNKFEKETRLRKKRRMRREARN